MSTDNMFISHLLLIQWTCYNMFNPCSIPEIPHPVRCTSDLEAAGSQLDILPWNSTQWNPETTWTKTLKKNLKHLSLSLSLPSCVYRIDIFLNNIKSAVDEWRALNSGTYFPNQSFPPIFENAFQERTNQLWTPSCSAFKPKRICCFTTPRRKPTPFFFLAEVANERPSCWILELLGRYWMSRNFLGNLSESQKAPLLYSFPGKRKARKRGSNKRKEKKEEQEEGRREGRKEGGKKKNRK